MVRGGSAGVLHRGAGITFGDEPWKSLAIRPQAHGRERSSPVIPRAPLPPLATAVAVIVAPLYAPKAATAAHAKPSTECATHTFGKVVDVSRSKVVVQSPSGGLTSVRVPTRVRPPYVDGASSGLRTREFVRFADRPGHPYPVVTQMAVGTRSFLTGPTLHYTAHVVELDFKAPGHPGREGMVPVARAQVSPEERPRRPQPQWRGRFLRPEGLLGDHRSLVWRRGHHGRLCGR